MKFSTTVVFTSLFAVVVVAFLYFNPHEKPKPVKTMLSGSMQLLDLTEDDEINWMQIQNIERNETITLIREDDVWILKYPIRYPADNWAVEELAKRLMLSMKVRQLMPEEDWEEYGLLRPTLKIGIETKKYPERRYLYIGDPSPVGDHVFARWEGENRYFLLEETLKHAFMRSAYSLREKHVFRMNWHDLFRIQFQSGTETYEIVRRKEEWFWALPVAIQGLSIERVVAEELLDRLKGLFVKDFVDRENTPWGDFGLEPPLSFIKLWGEEEESEVLYVGKELSIRDAFFGKRKEEDVLFLIDRNNIFSLFQTIESMAGNLTQVSAGGDLDLFR